MKNANLVTMYIAGEFFGNIQKLECKLVAHGTKKYAQYNNAPFVNFIPKGKRSLRGVIKSFQPYILILDGTGHPEPETVWGEK